jgi:hypothetical protein
MVKNIHIKINPNYKNNQLGIKCESDQDVTIADFIRVVDSLRNEHINLLKDYMAYNPNANVEKVTFKDFKK